MSLQQAKDKWTRRKSSQVLSGTLDRLYVTSGWFSDHDANLVVTPVASDRALEFNRFGVRNSTATIECEVHIDLFHRAQFLQWVGTLLHSEISLVGVYVDDDGHDGKTEIHPVDLIAGRINEPSSYNPSWWVAQLAAQRGLILDESLYAYRFAAASDNRRSWMLAGPPLSGVTRAASLRLDFPVRPDPSSRQSTAYRLEVKSHAVARLATTTSGSTTRLVLETTCTSARHGGPGVALGECVAFWKDPAVPEVELEPRELTFGTVRQMLTATRSVRIRNTAVAPLVVTLQASPGGAGSVFTWKGLESETIPPGGERVVSVTFRPRRPGTSTSVLGISTNNAIGPHTVTMSGRGRAGLPD